MRLLKLFVPIFLSIILIVLDARFSYLDSFKRFTLTLLSPIYLVVDLPSQVIDWVNDKGSENEILVSDNDFLEGQLIELKVKLQTFNNLALENQKLSNLLDASYLIPKHDVKLAKVNEEFSETVRGKYNNYGANIDKLPGWIIRQSSDPFQLRNALDVINTKNNYNIKGFVKEGKIDLLKKYEFCHFSQKKKHSILTFFY